MSKPETVTTVIKREMHTSKLLNIITLLMMMSVGSVKATKLNKLREITSVRFFFQDKIHENENKFYKK